MKKEKPPQSERKIRRKKTTAMPPGPLADPLVATRPAFKIDKKRVGTLGLVGFGDPTKVGH